jgi:tetratricopeptide (TPR) repeat protein
MNNELASQIHDGVFVLDDTNLAKVMEQARRAFKRQDWTKVLVWRDLLQYKLDTGRYLSQATRLNEWAIEAAQQLGQTELVARYVHGLADINSRQGYYNKAESLYQHSFEIYEQQVGDHASATKSLHMLALAKRALGKTAEAETLAHECLDCSELFDMGPWRAHPLHLLAWLARDRANYADALKYLGEALKIHKEHNEHDRGPMLAQSHYAIARILIMAGRLSEAETHISKTIAWSRREGTEKVSYMAEKLHGDLALSQGLAIKALQYYHLALDCAQTGPDERRVAETYLDLAQTYWHLGSPKKALGYLLSGISQLQRLGLLTLSRVKAVILQCLKR